MVCLSQLQCLLHWDTAIQSELFVFGHEARCSFLCCHVYLFVVYVLPFGFLNHSIVKLVQRLLHIPIREARVIFGGDSFRRWHDPALFPLTWRWTRHSLHLGQLEYWVALADQLTLALLPALNILWVHLFMSGVNHVFKRICLLLLWQFISGEQWLGHYNFI